jgi:hypothetical protein
MGTIALITPTRRHNGKPLFHSSPTFSILKSVGMPQVVLFTKATYPTFLTRFACPILDQMKTDQILFNVLLLIM